MQTIVKKTFYVCVWAYWVILRSLNSKILYPWKECCVVPKTPSNHLASTSSAPARERTNSRNIQLASAHRFPNRMLKAKILILKVFQEEKSADCVMPIIDWNLLDGFMLLIVMMIRKSIFIFLSRFSCDLTAWWNLLIYTRIHKSFKIISFLISRLKLLSTFLATNWEAIIKV